ncbi:MAG: glycosyltransferase [Desulfovibrio sp.]|nr:glycosyltransferase [Desulfovibrio sp.]
MPESPAAPVAPRPSRPRVLDGLGLPKTLPCSAADFLVLAKGGPDVTLLGLGPEPERLPQLLAGLAPSLAAGAGSVRFVECPELAAQLGDGWRARIPAHFAQAGPDDTADMARASALILYRPGPRLFPDFWGPLLARLQTARLPSSPAVDRNLVWLPGGETDLLRVELKEAFESLGFRVRMVPGEEDLHRLLAGGERPALFFSVNFSGIDPLGQAAHLLEAVGSRVAVWCVDNPLHLLSGLRARFWTRLPLFVTDDWFLGPPRELGAYSVRHLPLAARASQLAAPPRQPAKAFADLAQRLVFVGRSAFPGKADFFAGCATPAAAWTEAERMMAAGHRADFGWWLARLGIDRLWPGAEVRRAGFCAEETGKSWRAACLNAAQANLGGALTVFGDDGWRELLPQGTDLRPPVDYYTTLPDICASAAACLNCTSPLLPRGLTQRHFDVWASGGLLLTDATPGLDIFPPELTRDITFRAPEDIAPRLRALLASPDGGAGLKAAWRDELAARHTYAHRLKAVLEASGL